MESLIDHYHEEQEGRGVDGEKGGGVSRQHQTIKTLSVTSDASGKTFSGRSGVWKSCSTSEPDDREA